MLGISSLPISLLPSPPTSYSNIDASGLSSSIIT